MPLYQIGGASSDRIASTVEASHGLTADPNRRPA